MWANHLQAVAQRQGKTHPSSSSTANSQAYTAPAAITFNATNLPPISDTSSHSDGAEHGGKEIRPIEPQQQQGKITAVVNVPQSRYEYNPLEPPIIETPQLRDMGEATPPLEWIGLNRERLPNLTHQVSPGFSGGLLWKFLLTWGNRL